MSLGQELAKERKQLSGLIADTKAVIGDAASKHFKNLNRLPPQEYHPVNVPDGGLYDDRRFFQARRILRATATPTEKQPALLFRAGLLVVETATEVCQREHYYNNAGVRLRLPGKTQEVNVRVVRPHRIRSAPTTFAISPRGYATVGYSIRNTYPQKDNGDLSTGRYGYRSKEALRENYAASFFGALAAVSLVDNGIGSAHGTRLQTDNKEFYRVVAAWQQLGPAALSATSLQTRVLSFLP